MIHKKQAFSYLSQAQQKDHIQLSSCEDRDHSIEPHEYQCFPKSSEKKIHEYEDQTTIYAFDYQ